MTKSIAQIEAEIDALQGKLKLVEETQHRIVIKERSLTLSLEEKADAFDSLYNYVSSIMEEIVKDQYVPKDTKHWIFEYTMTTLFGDEVWSVWNKYVVSGS